MFVFIVPLRSQQTSKDWQLISRLCNETICSILNQTSPNYHILLICHELPIGFCAQPQVTVVRVHFPIPQSWEEGIGDMYRKIKRGMIEASQYAPTFIMRVDADDLVSRNLVSYSEQHSDSQGWYLRWGYIHEIGSTQLYLRPRFSAVSGTSTIVKCQKNDFPTSMDTPKDQWLEPIWQHLNTNQLLKPYGRRLRPLPFPGAVYRIYSSNMSGSLLGDRRFSSPKSRLWKLFAQRKLNQKLMDEFGFPDSGEAK